MRDRQGDVASAEDGRIEVCKKLTSATRLIEELEESLSIISNSFVDTDYEKWLVEKADEALDKIKEWRHE